MVKIVKEHPYSAYSQDVIERIYKTIRNALLSKSLEKQKHFDIEIDLPLIMNAHNNLIHKVSKYIPFGIFYSHDKNLYYEKRQKDSNSYEINEKCLLINNNTKSKKRMKKDIIL